MSRANGAPARLPWAQGLLRAECAIRAERWLDPRSSLPYGPAPHRCGQSAPWCRKRPRSRRRAPAVVARYAVAVVLSTATSTRWFLAAWTKAPMSHTSSCGLVGVSIHRSRAPSSAPACALSRVGARRTSIPIDFNQPAARPRVVSTSRRVARQLHQGLRHTPNTAATAAMPDARDRLTTLEHSQRFLPGRPGRIVKTPVGESMLGWIAR